MNTPTILLAFVIVVFFIGCNNELNLMDTYDYSGISQSNKQGNENKELLWKLDELCVKISNENMVENKAAFICPPFMFPADYQIKFDSYTDANKYTNGFVPIIQVKKDGDSVFEGAECPDANPEGVCHREIMLNNVRFSNLTFYIVLMQGDNPPVSRDDGFCTLKLSNIMVYLLN